MGGGQAGEARLASWEINNDPVTGRIRSVPATRPVRRGWSTGLEILEGQVVARHRSPVSRRAHLGFSSSVMSAAAGTGGAYRLAALPQVDSSPRVSALSVRIMAAAVAGSALAATAQMVLTEALPSVLDGDDVLLLGVGELFTSGGAVAPEVAVPDPALIDAGPVPARAPMLREPQVVSAADLVAAAGLDQPRAEQAARAAVQATSAVEQAARAAEEARAAESSALEAARTGGDADTTTGSATATATGGGVQMMVGRVSSGFGPRWDAQHKGLDIAAPIGTPIRVPLDGTVISSGPASGFGLWVRVRHTDGTVTLYGHIDRTLVEVGQRVSAGEVIAEVGNRGQSTGPHLHFEVIEPGGDNINPTPWLAGQGIDFT